MEDTLTTEVIDKDTVHVVSQAPQPPIPDPITTVFTMDQIEEDLIDCDNGDSAALNAYNSLLAEHDAKRQDRLTMKQAILDWRTAHPEEEE